MCVCVCACVWVTPSAGQRRPFLGFVVFDFANSAAQDHREDHAQNLDDGHADDGAVEERHRLPHRRFHFNRATLSHVIKASVSFLFFFFWCLQVFVLDANIEVGDSFLLKRRCCEKPQSSHWFIISL